MGERAVALWHSDLIFTNGKVPKKGATSSHGCMPWGPRRREGFRLFPQEETVERDGSLTTRLLLDSFSIQSKTI
jgi:hypothetical protein